MSMRIKGKENLFRALQAVAPTVAKHLAEANHQTATEIVELARRLAPAEDGTLRDSIKMTPGPRETAVTISAGGAATTRPVREGADATYDYALAQEFGTVKMPANPFFWPSYRVGKRAHRRRISKAFKAAIKEAGF